jgi:CDP-paratose 2-epimerase
MKKILITGSNGLIGSQCVQFFCERGVEVIGIDNNMRSYFFGEESSTDDVGKILSSKFDKYEHHNLDIRDKDSLEKVFQSNNIDLIIHAAAQPSHDWAAKEPITDFEVNALATIYLLELYRQYCPSASFIFTSTNKVYGDQPNHLNLKEENSRIEYYDENGNAGSVNESMSIDNCLHSVFGASKVAADVMVQEYGRYFGLDTVVFRCGCLTGPSHKGAELHGFLSYLIKCMVHNKHYTIFGNGKQVRDNLHSWDLANMFWHFYQSPHKGEIYNAGGGRENSTSILEAINKINLILVANGMNEWNKFDIKKDKWRIGDHKWYISDLSKFQSHYPSWTLEHSLNALIEEMTLKEMATL